MNHKYILPISLMIIAVGFFVGMVLLYNNDIYSDADTEDKCSAIVGKDCGAWNIETKTCRKGHGDADSTGSWCMAKSDKKPAICLGLGTLFLVVGITILVMKMRES